MTYNPDQPRDYHGRWSGNSGDLPPAPGTAPIPEGHVRLYHQTAEENLAGIWKNGIKLDSARGIEGPKAIYADEKGFYGKPGQVPTVEFSVPKERWDAPFVRADSVLDKGMVAPENIIGIHYPWQEHARYAESHPEVKASILAGEHDDLANDRNYGRANQYIKDKYGEPQHDPATTQYMATTHEPTTGGRGAEVMAGGIEKTVKIGEQEYRLARDTFAAPAGLSSAELESKGLTTFYHGTAVDNIASIKNSGLREPVKGEGVYLSTNPLQAGRWGEMKYPGKEIGVVAVDLKGSMRNVRGKGNAWNDEYLHAGPIPSSSVRSVLKHNIGD